MNWKRLAGAVLFLGLASSQAGAWDYGEFISCNAINPDPTIIFKTSYGKLVHDLSHPVASVNSMSGTHKEPGWLTVGLASAPIHSSIGGEYFVKKISANVTCVLPSKIEVYVGYVDPLIYISKEYQEDKCKFSVVIRHEQTHQRINKLTLDYFIPLMDKAIRNAIADVKAVKVASPEQGREGWMLLYKYYRARLQPIIDTMVEARNAEHAKMDSMTSYRMQWDMCDKFAKRVNREDEIKKLEEAIKAEDEKLLKMYE